MAEKQTKGIPFESGFACEARGRNSISRNVESPIYRGKLKTVFDIKSDFSVKIVVR